MTVNILDVACYVFGESVISQVIILPAFMTKLGASPLLVALLPAVQILGARLPPLATSYLVEGRPKVLRWCILMGIGQRLPWLIVAFLALAVGPSRAGLLLAAVFLATAASATSFGLGSPAYGELIAKAIPPARRGLFMGLNLMLGSGLGILGGVIATLVLTSRLTFPADYAALFFIASAILGVSFVFFCLNRESPGHDHRRHFSFASYLAEIPVVLRNDRPFCWYLVYQSLIYAYAMGSGLFMTYALRRFDLGDAATGAFVLTVAIATAAAAPLLGILGDRVGHKSVLCIACVSHIVAALIATFAADWRWMFPVFALTAVCLAAQVVSARNYIFLFGVNGRRPTYLALANTLPAPFILLFSAGGGWMAQSPRIGYSGAFLVSAALCALACAVLLTKVAAPADRSISKRNNP